MIIMEFDSELTGHNHIRYRDLDSADEWHSMELDVEILQLLIMNFGYNPYYIRQALDSYLDTIEVSYYGATIQLIPRDESNKYRIPWELKKRLPWKCDF